jgi:PAS domain S-box-containing protein
MSAENTDRKTPAENPLLNQELYRVFLTQSSEGIWRMELENPVPVDLHADEQIELLYRSAYLAECNPAMARMYGYELPEEIVGARFGDLLVREDPANIEHLINLIDSGYRMEDAESHEVDRNGNSKFFLNNIIGIVENGHLKRIWGTQREITERKGIELSKARLAAIVESSHDAIISKDLEPRRGENIRLSRRRGDRRTHHDSHSAAFNRRRDGVSRKHQTRQIGRALRNRSPAPGRELRDHLADGFADQKRDGRDYRRLENRP